MKLLIICAFVVLTSSLEAQGMRSADLRRSTLVGGASVYVSQDSSTKRKPSRAGRVAIGISIGAIVGGAIGYGIGNAQCANGHCDDALPIYAPALLGVVLGGTLGGIIAYVQPAPTASSQGLAINRYRPIVKVRISL